MSDVNLPGEQEDANKLYVCFVAPVPPPYGGISNWVQLMRRYLHEKENIHVSVINTTPVSAKIEGRSLWERIVAQGLQMIKNIRELKKMIKENRPDVIHVTTSGQLAIFRDIAIMKVARNRNIRTIYHLHFGRVSEIEARKTVEWKMLCMAMSTASKVIAIDKNTFEIIKKYLPSSKAVYVPNPVDLTVLPEPLENNSRVVLYLGWIIKSKGIEELLTAWGRVSEKYGDWKLKLVGPCTNSYLEYLKSKFDFNNVIYEGEKSHDEAMNILNDAEILVLPSYTEGFPNVILEAMALKKVIVATSVGAIPEMLSNGCGMLIEPRNHDEIEKALDVIISDCDMRQNLRSNAYKKLISKYTIETIYSRYFELWKR